MRARIITPFKLQPLELMVYSILFGVVSNISIGGKTPNLFRVDLVVLGFILGWGIKVMLSKRVFSFSLAGVEVWAALYIAMAMVTLPMTEDVSYSIAILKLHSVPLLIFIFTYNLMRTEQNVFKLMETFTTFGAILSAMTLFNWYRFFTGAVELPEGLGFKDMAQTSWGRSNFLASIFIVIILVALSIYLINKSKMLLVKIGLMMSGLLATQSRGGMVCLICGLIVWGMLVSGKRIRNKFTTLALVMVLFGSIASISYYFFPPELFELLFSKFTNIESETTIYDDSNNRLSKINLAWSFIQKNPLWGIGLGNQNKLVFINGSAHNLLLETWLETGVFSLIALVIFLFLCGRMLFKLTSRGCDTTICLLSCGLFAGYVAAMVNALQEPSFWAPQYSYLFWMMLASAFVLQRHLIRRSGHECT